MNTALNLMNLTPEAPTPAPYRDVADSSRVQQTRGKDEQDSSQQDSESSFARVLESESGNGKKEVAGSSATRETRETGESRADKQQSTNTEEPADASESAAPAGSEANTHDAVQLSETDSSDIVLDAAEDLPETDSGNEAVAEMSLTLQAESRHETRPALTTSTENAAKIADKQTVITSQPGQETGKDAVVNTVAAPAEPQDESADLALVQTARGANPIQNSAKPESFPAAGKDLPASGKNLPSGFFPAGDSDQDTVNRMTDQKSQLTQGMDISPALTGRANPAMEFSAESLWRTLVGGNVQTGTDNTATPQAASPAELLAATSAAALTASPDKTAIAGRSNLPPLLENTASSLGFHITAAAGSHDWNQQISSRIRWMGNVNMSSAELKLHPAELGTVEVKISTEDDQTRVSFITSNPQTRELIESSLPRLRELLGDSGLQLEQGDVSHRDMAGQASEDSATGKGGGNAEQTPGDDIDASQPALHISRNSTSQIDHYV